jgi:hypothetical protein
MALVVLEYDWIPGQRPNGLPEEDPVEVGDPPAVATELALRCGRFDARGVVTASRPDVGGITVLSISVTEADDIQGFVDRLQAEEAVGVALLDADDAQPAR